ncbi:hect-domain (ubiquitin-transferase) domain-containing protein, partial [Cystoisospora suis]
MGKIPISLSDNFQLAVSSLPETQRQLIQVIATCPNEDLIHHLQPFRGWMWEKQGDVTAWAPALNRFDDIMVAYARQKGLYPRGSTSSSQANDQTTSDDRKKDTSSSSPIREGETDRSFSSQEKRRNDEQEEDDHTFIPSDELVLAVLDTSCTVLENCSSKVRYSWGGDSTDSSFSLPGGFSLFQSSIDHEILWTECVQCLYSSIDVVTCLVDAFYLPIVCSAVQVLAVCFGFVKRSRRSGLPRDCPELTSRLPLLCDSPVAYDAFTLTQQPDRSLMQLPPDLLYETCSLTENDTMIGAGRRGAGAGLNRSVGRRESSTSRGTSSSSSSSGGTRRRRREQGGGDLSSSSPPSSSSSTVRRSPHGEEESEERSRREGVGEGMNRGSSIQGGIQSSSVTSDEDGSTTASSSRSSAPPSSPVSRRVDLLTFYLADHLPLDFEGFLELQITVSDDLASVSSSSYQEASSPSPVSDAVVCGRGGASPTSPDLTSGGGATAVTDSLSPSCCSPPPPPPPASSSQLNHSHSAYTGGSCDGGEDRRLEGGATSSSSCTTAMREGASGHDGAASGRRLQRDTMSAESPGGAPTINGSADLTCEGIVKKTERGSDGYVSTHVKTVRIPCSEMMLPVVRRRRGERAIIEANDEEEDRQKRREGGRARRGHEGSEEDTKKPKKATDWRKDTEELEKLFKHLMKKFAIPPQYVALIRHKMRLLHGLRSVEYRKELLNVQLSSLSCLLVVNPGLFSSFVSSHPFFFIDFIQLLKHFRHLTARTMLLCADLLSVLLEDRSFYKQLTPTLGLFSPHDVDMANTTEVSHASTTPPSTGGDGEGDDSSSSAPGRSPPHEGEGESRVEEEREEGEGESRVEEEKKGEEEEAVMDEKDKGGENDGEKKKDPVEKKILPVRIEYEVIGEDEEEKKLRDWPARVSLQEGKKNNRQEDEEEEDGACHSDEEERGERRSQLGMDTLQDEMDRMQTLLHLLAAYASIIAMNSHTIPAFVQPSLLSALVGFLRNREPLVIPVQLFAVRAIEALMEQQQQQHGSSGNAVILLLQQDLQLARRFEERILYDAACGDSEEGDDSGDEDETQQGGL